MAASDLMRKLSPEKQALLTQRLREKKKLTPQQKTPKDEISGPIHLTNSQRWFFFGTQYSDLHHWNIASMVMVPATLNLTFVEQALRSLLEHHDALRTRFFYQDADWHALIAPIEEKVPFRSFDFSGLTAEEQKAAIEQKAAEIQTSFNLSAGMLLHVAHFNLGPNLPGRLLFIAHHLIVDGSSLPILMQDFQTAYLQLSIGDAVQLPPKTTSIKEIAARLNAFARSAELRKEVDYWASFPWKHTPLPLDFDQMEINTEGSIRIIDTSLTVEETNVLLRELPKRYNTRIMDVLIAALLYTITEWSGGDWAQFIVLDSGRNILHDDDINVSRTVGVLFASALAILNRDRTNSLSELLLSTKKQLQDIPHQGIGYELLRYCSKDPIIVERLKPIFKSEVKFNYLGQFNNANNLGNNVAGNFQAAPESTGPGQNMQNIRAEILYITAIVFGGRLTLNWWYSENLHKRSTIEKVANTYMDALRALLTQL